MWLVVLFTIAVVAIVASVYAVVSGVLLVSAQDADALGLLLDPRMLAPVAGGTLALIGGGSVYKVAAALRRRNNRGRAARRPPDPVRCCPRDGATPAERHGGNGHRLRHAGADGLSARHESGINAFAAGTSPATP